MRDIKHRLCLSRFTVISDELVGTWQARFFGDLFSPVHIETEATPPVKERLRYWGMCHVPGCNMVYRVEPGYNDIGVCDTSVIASDILWHQLIPHC